MELLDYLTVLRKRWTTVVASCLIVVAAATVFTIAATPEYEATTRLFFAVPSGESATDLAQGSSFTERQMSSYAQVATSPLVLAQVAESLGLESGPTALARQIRASVPANTVILEITASSEDPQEAADLANAIGSRFNEVVSSLYPARPDGTQSVLVSVLSKAVVPDSPSSPSMRRNLALGLLLGLGLGVGAALIQESVDTRIRSVRDISVVTDRPVLGTVTFDAEASAHPIVMVDRPDGLRAESIRRLRTNLQFVDTDGRARAVLVTSSVASEGKTTTIVNLAVALADAGSRVLLIDADLRRPSLHKVLGLEGSAGLTTVLIGRAQAVDVIQPWCGGRVDVLAAGSIPPNPSELLGSVAMAALLEDLTSKYDVILVDSPPLLPVTDAAILSTRVDGTLLVVGASLTHRPQLRSAIDALDAVGSRILGVVLNRVSIQDSGAYGNYQEYAYSQRADDPS